MFLHADEMAGKAEPVMAKATAIFKSRRLQTFSFSESW
jgi:hypothetical protein